MVDVKVLGSCEVIVELRVIGNVTRLVENGVLSCVD